jgi:hypothetical protein
MSTNTNDLETQSTISLNLDSSSPSKNQYHHHSQPHAHLHHSINKPRLAISKHKKSEGGKRRTFSKRRQNRANKDSGEDQYDSDDNAQQSGAFTKRRDLLKAATLSALDSSKIDLNRSSSPIARDELLGTNRVSFHLNQSGNRLANANSNTNRHSFPSSYNKTPSQSGIVDVLIIVVHGGNVTCTDTSKQSDFINFKTTLDNIIKANHGGSSTRVAYRLITCEPICKDALIKLAT